MTSSLETRIERLEQHGAADDAASECVLLVSFVSPGGALPLDRVTDWRGQAWQRAEGESERAFVDRACACADAPRRGCARVLIATACSAV